MPDIIQQSYEVLNHFLGETNNRNLKRLPEKHEPLLREIEKLVQYAYQLGKVCGESDAKFELKRALQPFQEVVVRYPQYKFLEAEENK